jgi:Icc-related predicted phosphoesterase
MAGLLMQHVILDDSAASQNLLMIERTLKIACLSDTHELHRSVDMPSCDLLIHAGDWTFFSRSRTQIKDFNEWLGEQYAPLGRVLCPGNHEQYLVRDPRLRSLTPNGTVLMNGKLSIKGLKLWASPVTSLSSSAFAIPEAKDRARLYSQIPSDTDILITHGPPYGILDCSPGDSKHSGCRELLKAVVRIKPKIHVFGHVHAGYGIHQTPDTTFVNAALLGPDGDIANHPILLSLDRI